MSDRFRPTAAAYRRAVAAGLDLDALRESDPDSFRMFAAEEVCLTSVALAEEVGDRFFAAFPGRDLFQLPDAVAGRVRLLAFEPLNRDELGAWEGDLGRLSDTLAERGAYFRVVEDLRGVTRELALPVDPEAWTGEPVVVGPFADEGSAHDFGGRATAGGPLAYDLFPLRGGWICDLYLADDPALDRRSARRP